MISLTVDTVLFGTNDPNILAEDTINQLHVLLIRRDQEPFKGSWALPGGYMDAGETARAAAARELREEADVDVWATDLRLVGVFDEPGRDPRGDVISLAYSMVIPQLPPPTAGDDAAVAQWVRIQDIAEDELAFDHAEILNAALRGLPRKPRP